MKTKLAEMSGSILEYCTIDQTQIWNIETFIPSRQQNKLGPDVLNSDWRYREDLIWLKYDKMQIAAGWKQRLEVQQRRDRKNRQDFEKKRNKNSK